MDYYYCYCSIGCFKKCHIKIKHDVIIHGCTKPIWYSLNNNVLHMRRQKNLFFAQLVYGTYKRIMWHHDIFVASITKQLSIKGLRERRKSRKQIKHRATFTFSSIHYGRFVCGVVNKSEYAIIGYSNC